jgi:hypothetical protein
MSKNTPTTSEERSNAMTYNTPLPISGRDPDSVPFEERIAELEEAKRDPVKAIRATRERRNQEQLAAEREARRRADTIIAQLARANEEQARTIRELEAPSEPPSGERESPETVEEEPERAESLGPLREGLRRAQKTSPGLGGGGCWGHDPITSPHARYSPSP